MTDPMTPNHFLWFITLGTGGVSVVWLVWDLGNFKNALKLDMSIGTNRDKRFGHAIGVLIATIGIIGSAHAQGWV